MPLNIRANIEAVNERIKLNKTIGRNIGNAAMDAIFDGKGTHSWRKLMLYYAKNPSPELSRLCGEDDDFMDLEWGPRCIAYIAGDAACGSETVTMTGALRSIMDRDKMKGNTDMWDTIDATGQALTDLLTRDGKIDIMEGREEALAVLK